MKLVVVQEGVKFDFPMTGGDVVVGRSTKCDLSLDDRNISGKHFLLRREGDEYFVQDLLSKNGTFLNGEKVHIARLKNGDVIAAGSVNLTFTTEAGEVSAAGEKPAAQYQPPMESGAPTETALYGAPVSESAPPTGGTLLPEKYDPQKVRLVARGDRLFMVDAEGKREVELVPAKSVEGAGASPLARAGAEVLRKHKKVVLAAATALVCIGLSVALLVFTGDRGTPSPEPGPSVTQYSQKVDEAIALFRTGKLQESSALLEELKRTSPQNAVAFVLADAVDLWHGVAEDYSNFDWADAQTRFKELRASTGATPDTIALANEKLGWIATERENEALVYEGLNRKSRGQLEEAHRAFKQIPPDSIYRRRYAKEIEATRMAFRNGLIEEANRHASEGKWNDSIAVLKKACEQCGEDAGLTRLIEACQTNAGVIGKLEEVRKLISEGRHDAASAILDSLPPEHAYVKEVQEIRGELRDARAIAQALDLYDRGEAALAIKLLENTSSKYASTVRDKISKVARTYEEYRKAINEDRLDDALRHMTSIRALESDRDNCYRIWADEFIQQVSDPRGMARKYLELATKRYAEEDYKKARVLAQKALESDPDEELGRELLSTIRSKATQLYNEALNLKAADPGGARKLFEKARDLLPPEDPLHTRIIEQLAEMD